MGAPACGTGQVTERGLSGASLPRHAPPEIETDRLRLRGWRPEDLAPFAEVNADPEVMRHLSGRLSRRESDLHVARFIVKWQEEPRFGWWALETRDGTFLGMVGLAWPDFETPPAPCVEIGWRLARQAWGRGYATEAANAALAHGFGVVGLEEVLSFTVAQNRRSRAVMDRVGLTEVEAGAFDHPLVAPESQLQRHLLYRLTRAEWEARA